MSLTIVPLDSRLHDRASFDCGNVALDRYLQQQASQDVKKNVAMVFVLQDGSSTEILAYYTLSAYTIEITELSDALVKKLPRYPLLPATLLGRLAVDRRQQGKGFGALMLVDALQKALVASAQIASVAVVVDAIDDVAMDFYRKYGFEQFRQHEMKLYLPMGLIAQLL